MAIKKLIFCVLFFIQAMNATEETFNKNEDFNEESSSKAVVEDNVFINKNTWNTRKWGDIYVFIPHFSVTNLWFKLGKQYSIRGILENKYGIMFNWLFSAGLEYKYFFHKRLGINIRLNLNNLERIGFLTKTFIVEGKSGRRSPKTCEMYSSINSIKLEEGEILVNKDFHIINTEIGYTFFSLEFAFEWIYGKRVVRTNEGIFEMVYSSSFSPIGFAFYIISFDSRDFIAYKEKFVFTGSFIPLKIEFGKASFINFGKIKFNWHTLLYLCKDEACINFLFNLLYNFFSLEFGINIIQKRDDQKKLNDRIEY